MNTSYITPIYYARKTNIYFNRYLLSKLERLLPIEGNVEVERPPVFIVGPPRSGSTLLMQVITDAFDFGYISNYHCRWFGCPAIAEKIRRQKEKKQHPEYHSVFGQTRGLTQPAECGEWWRRFFPKHPDYVTSEQINNKKMVQFRNSVATLTEAFDRPLIFKNLYASVRICPIVEILPQAIFLVIHRNEVDNGQSILDARYKLYGNYTRWLSVAPPNVEYLKKLPPHAQVIQQIRQIHSVINRDLKQKNVPESRRIDIHYEKLCTDTHSVIKQLDDFFKTNQCHVEKKYQVPESFSPSKSLRIHSSIYKDMKEYARAN